MCVGGLFSTPKLPDLPTFTAPELPTPPTVADPAVAQATERARRIAGAQLGRASTVLTGPLGISNDNDNQPASGGKTVLGA